MNAEQEMTGALEKEDFKPGLSNLNLNILHGNDMYMIEDTITDILHSIEEEHSLMQTIERVFLAVLKSKLPRKRSESRQELENILIEHPNHLNALTELEKIYRSLYRISDADKLKKRYETICAREENIDETITCLLEQGFLLRIERTLVNEHSLLQQMGNMRNMIKHEYEKSEKNKRNSLGKSLNSFDRCVIQVEEAFSFTSPDGHYQRIKESLLKYEHALRLRSLSDLHPAWRFQYAKTLSQFYSFLDDLDKRGNEKYQTEMIEVTVKTILIFWNITQLSSSNGHDDMQRYKAQSYAYLGHIIFSRNQIIGEVLSRLSEESKFVNSDFDKYVKNPILFNETSFKLFPIDVVVLIRYGRSLWLCSKHTQDVEEKREYLRKSLTYLTKSIEKDRIGNRFSLSCRMEVNRDLAKLEPNRTQSEQLLKNAKEDGKGCSTCMPTRRDMSNLAEICQMLAKFPNFNDYGIRSVKSIEHLHEALEFLQYGNTLGEPIDEYFTYRMASCMFDLDELEQAAQWQERTWFLSSGGSNNFVLMCFFMLRVIEKKGKDVQQIRKLLSFFIVGEIKYGYDEMEKNYLKVYRKGTRIYFNTIDMIISTIVNDGKTFSIDNTEKKVLEHYLKILKENDCRQNEIRDLDKQLIKIRSVPEKDYSMTDIVRLPSGSWLPDQLEKAFSENYKYDYFISYSSHDKSFVHSILIPQLETKLKEGDFPLKGCLAERDFKPGDSVLDNIESAIAESHKVILILSKAFVESVWCKKEMSQAICKNLQSGRGSHVVPVVYEQCDIPPHLIDITYLDIRYGDLHEKILKLKRVFVSENEPCI